MTINEIDATVGKNTQKAGIVSLEDIYILSKYGVTCLLKEGEVDFSQYYYEIDTNELLHSEFPSSELKYLQEMGFSYLDETKKKIVKFVELI